MFGMKKKKILLDKKIIILFIFAIITFPKTVFANEMTITCPEKADKDTSIDCIVKANLTDNSTDQIKFTYYNDNITYIGFTPTTGWRIEEGSTNESTGLVLRNDNELNGQITLGTITYKLPNSYDDANISISGFDGTNTNAQIVRFSNANSTSSVHIRRTNNNIKNILINGNEIGFDNKVTLYTYNTTNQTIQIHAELEDEYASCEELDREVTLTEGINTIKYTVYAEDGSKKIYEIRVNYTFNNNQTITDENNSDDTESTNNNPKITTNIKKVLKTGDDISVYLVILVTSLLSILIILKINKNKKRNISEF